MRFEWQHHGSPHVHGVAWLPNALDVEQLLASAELPDTLRNEVIQHADRTVTTLSPALSSSADSESQLQAPVTNPHVCNQSYLDVQDHHQDLCELVFIHDIVTRSIDLATPSHYSQRPPL